jgi:hypothetical protein
MIRKDIEVMTKPENKGQVLREQRNALLLTIESIEGTVEHSRIKSLDAIVSILNAMIDSADKLPGAWPSTDAELRRVFAVMDELGLRENTT